MRNHRIFTKITTSILLLLAFFLASISSVQAERSIPEPTKDFFVYDEANLLSSDTKQTIMQKNIDWREEFGKDEAPQFVVAIFSNMDGEDIDAFRVRVFEKWQVGSKDLDNGLLLIHSVEENKTAFEVGYGLEGALTDSQTYDLLKDNYDELKGENVNAGLVKSFTNASKIIDKEIDAKGVDGTQYNSNKEENSKYGFSWRSVFAKLDAIIIVIIIIILSIKFPGSGMFIGSGGGGFSGGSRGGGGGGFSGGGGRSGGGGSSI